MTHPYNCTPLSDDDIDMTDAVVIARYKGLVMGTPELSMQLKHLVGKYRMRGIFLHNAVQIHFLLRRASKKSKQ